MQSNAAPRVAVIMPAYNASEYIHASVSSILKQSFRELELIVVNDGSVDNTAEILARMPDAEHHAHHTEHNGTAQKSIADKDAGHPGKDEQDSHETDENIERYPSDAEELIPQFIMRHG